MTVKANKIIYEYGEPKIGASVIRGLELALAECGVDYLKLLAIADIDSKELQKLNGQLSLRKYLNFMEQAAILAGDPILGIRLARSCGAETLGAIGFLFLSSRSLFSALSDFCLYMNLLQDRASLSVERSQESLIFNYDIFDLPNAEWRQDVEFSLALSTRLIRMFTGSSAVIDTIGFRHSAGAKSKVYEQALNTQVRFGQEANSIIMPVSIGTMQSHAMDPGLSDILKAHLDSEMRSRLNHHSFKAEVNRILLANLIEAPVTAEKMAEYLALSPATLYRRLRGEGTSFNQVSAEVSFELAKSYLADSSLSVTQISQIVGFAEAASFTRAFLRWSDGITPSAYRKLISGGVGGAT
ncbi:MAG: AraC-like DNA-binding protein [Candidatus Azotimanducaceae bacterium]|jgi:AraC-like DNA-binding protein